MVIKPGQQNRQAAAVSEDSVSIDNRDTYLYYLCCKRMRLRGDSN